jgi:hypothetical protein
MGRRRDRLLSRLHGRCRVAEATYLAEQTQSRRTRRVPAPADPRHPSLFLLLICISRLRSSGASRLPCVVSVSCWGEALPYFYRLQPKRGQAKVQLAIAGEWQPSLQNCRGSRCSTAGTREGQHGREELGVCRHLLTHGTPPPSFC